jgi:hypothetical protein
MAGLLESDAVCCVGIPIPIIRGERDVEHRFTDNASLRMISIASNTSVLSNYYKY